jgi:hypothetical protein
VFSNFSKIIFLGFLFSTAGLIFVSAASLEYPVQVTVTGGVKGQIQWAIPEGRVGASSTNWDSVFYLRAEDSLTHEVVDQMADLATTTVAGEYLTDILLSNLGATNYDIVIKTNQHLSRRLANIPLVEGLNIFNFSTTDNQSGVTGPVRLLAGDISGIGVSPGTLGDNEINSVDLSIVLGVLDGEDITGNDVRSNLNQDAVINSVDLSLLLKNLDEQGE